MNTGGKSRNDLVAGSWVQVCGGCLWCNKRRKRRVFQIVDPLPPDILAQPLLKELFDARAELYGTASHAATAPAPAPLASVHAPAPAPMPATTPTPALTPAPTPTPAPLPAPAPVAAEEAAIERSTSPQTPIRALHFDYRGTHSQPNVLVSDSDDEEGELQYPPDVTLDVCTPVLLFAWYNRRATYPNDGLSTLGSAWDPPYWRGHPAGLQGGPPCAGTPSWVTDPTLPRRHGLLEFD
ncbi:hypothetical protein B0H10DRAFT_1037400 [Mycena sp. CBHHK59/15]|nr:hypothetical protein B0H10DRAFT_1037400 [Mycena sp. CBHHK59/15]